MGQTLIHDLACLPPTALGRAWSFSTDLLAGGVATVDGEGNADEACIWAAKPQHGAHLAISLARPSHPIGWLASASGDAVHGRARLAIWRHSSVNSKVYRTR